jgi:hypothetical protein
LRKSGKKVDIKTAEIWENNAEMWQLIAEFWQLIDFSQLAEIWENVAELWCFPQNWGYRAQIRVIGSNHVDISAVSKL